MITYFLKSGLCLALLLAFYHLVLEREKMHTFNRFFLLGSVLFSFLAPLYVIYEYIPVVTENFVPIMIDNGFTPSEVIVEEPFNYTPYLIGLYVLISSLLLIRFCKNLFLIILKIRKSRHLQLENATIVLVEDAISPHTFWNYIFINKEEYFSETIENELFTHELTHVTQKHTIDILLIEFLQMLFWINPTFILLKKAVKLNHEFLADNKVISTYKNTTEYQYLLLNRATWNNEYYLASNLNYLLTKKRLQMMTKQSSRTLILLKKLAVIPLLVGFIFLFAERVVAQEKADSKIVAEYNKLAKKYNNQSKEKLIVKLKEVQRMEELYSKLNDTQKLNAEKYPNIPPPPPPIVKNGQVVKGDFAPPPPPKPIKVKKGVKYDGDIPPPLPPKKTIFIQNRSENSKQSIVEDFQETEPKTGWLYVNNQTLYYVKDKRKTTYYNRWGQKVDKTGKIVNTEQTKSDEVIPNQNISKVYKNDIVAVEFKRNNLPKRKNINRVSTPPSPSRPISPLDFMKEQKDNNADYFYNGKKVNYIKAIELLKRQRPIQIRSEKVNGKMIINLTKKNKVSSLDSIPTKTGLEQVGNKVYAYKITNGKKQYFDEKSGRVISIKHPKPEFYDEVVKRNKNTKKIFYLDNEHVSKQTFKKTVKNDKSYHLFMLSKKNDNNTVIVIASKKDLNKDYLLKKYR